MTPRPVLVACTALVAALLGPVAGGVPLSPAAASASSLPSVSGGARPGPDVLYAPPPAAPQLENRSPHFRAQPLMVMGADAYIDGEYLYQDWIYDDSGSDTGASDTGANSTAGDIDYPTDRARYAGNAADLVEVRVAPNADEVAYRFTLNALTAPDSTIVALAFDTDRNATTGRATLPRDAGFSFPGTDEVITTWGTGAEHSRLSTTGSATTTALTPVVDLEANQITVVVPRAVSDPAGAWRATVATGLFDAATGGWLRPGLTATATHPGGAAPLDPAPSGVFNLGFRFDERPSGLNPHEARQAAVIRSKFPGPYQRDIDFGALARRENRSNVPTTGTFSRIFASRISFGEGKDYTTTPEMLGQLQPYSISVPASYAPSAPAGLTVALHSHQQHHWQYNLNRGFQQIGEERGNIVATCECRGEDGWYQDEAEYDVFEMWHDVASMYSLDAERVTLYGYSMGGYGVYRLATLYPDLFGAAFTIAGPPAETAWVPPLAPRSGTAGLTNEWLENARHVPFLNVAGALDALVPVTSTRAQNLGAPEAGVRGFEQLGYRYRYALYPAADHFSFAFTGYDIPYARQFVGDGSVTRDPSHVTFAYVPATDSASLGLVHDHAYWISGAELADTLTSPLPKAVVDAVSHAAGVGDPPSTLTQAPGVGPTPYAQFTRTWGAAPAVPAENKLTLRLDNVGRVIVDLARAALDPGLRVTVAVTATHAGTVLLDGVQAGARVEDSTGAPVVGAVVVGGRAAVPVAPGQSTFVVRPS